MGEKKSNTTLYRPDLLVSLDNNFPMWSKLICFVHDLCSGKNKTDSLQHLPNASSVTVTVLSLLELGLVLMEFTG